MRFVFGCVAILVSGATRATLGAATWSFPLPMLVSAPFILVSGLIMGLHHDPPPWRRHTRTR